MIAKEDEQTRDASDDEFLRDLFESHRQPTTRRQMPGDAQQFSARASVTYAECACLDVPYSTRRPAGYRTCVHYTTSIVRASGRARIDRPADANTADAISESDALRYASAALHQERSSTRDYL